MNMNDKGDSSMNNKKTLLTAKREVLLITNNTATSSSITTSTNFTARPTTTLDDDETSMSNLEPLRHEECKDLFFNQNRIYDSQAAFCDSGCEGTKKKSRQEQLPTTSREKKRQYREILHERGIDKTDGNNSRNNIGDYISLSERKKFREKKRRKEITNAIDQLSKMLLRVDPSTFIEHNNQVYSTPNVIDLDNKKNQHDLQLITFPHQNHKEEVRQQYQPLNRTSTINHAAILLEKLATESEETKIELLQLQHMFLMNKNHSGRVPMTMTSHPEYNSGTSNIAGGNSSSMMTAAAVSSSSFPLNHMVRHF